MPWCPKCKAEYREGFTKCSDCDVDLVPKLEESTDKDANVVYDKEVFLISVANDLEAKRIEALLQFHGIPVLRKYKGAGELLQVYMSATIYGIDMFVSSRSLEAAKEILNAEYIPLIEYDKNNVEEKTRSNFTSELGRKRRIKTWIIILVFMPGLLWIIYSIISGIFK